MKVLIVEDERLLGALLRKALERENHNVTVAHDGAEGLALAVMHEFDVLVLDIMLPKLDGFEVARRLRQRGRTTPILMLTARDSVPDIVRGLDLGADDYLAKPFALEEFFARLRAAARHRAVPAARAQLCVENLVLDPATREVTRAGRPIQLSATEFRLLEFLMRRAGRVALRAAILEGVWGLDRDVAQNNLDAFMRLLRRKIDRDCPQKLIQTVRGVGYTVRAESHE
ncbi:MAG TPA: response regulator transcription factor [Steroidobacteraceae bacterium]|nr:response regulator transcription factor [Steroidobacteraceae bacterium]